MSSAASRPSIPKPDPHILIIGAGITGLLFAQSLRKREASSPSLPTRCFTIFERDPTPSFRGAGWGLTIHWGLKDFLYLLPQYLIDRLPETYVNPESVEKGEKGNFILYDLHTGEEKYRVPPSERIRVSRERLRALLMDGLDIQV
jgi:2-polyprenyl-6-methoxyphenol hydroxylase-like FAD-dependent oxidoreductase